MERYLNQKCRISFWNGRGLKPSSLLPLVHCTSCSRVKGVYTPPLASFGTTVSLEL